jgi:hypothetical protein
MVIRGNRLTEAYQSEALSEGCGKQEQKIYGRAQPLHQGLITLSGVVECVCLLLKYFQYDIGGVTVIEFGSEWVRLEVLACLFLVFLRCSVEYGTKGRESDGCAAGGGHSTSGVWGGCSWPVVRR